VRRAHEVDGEVPLLGSVGAGVGQPVEIVADAGGERGERTGVPRPAELPRRGGGGLEQQGGVLGGEDLGLPAARGVAGEDPALGGERLHRLRLLLQRLVRHAAAAPARGEGENGERDRDEACLLHERRR
jgi:hypothetical protein